MNSTRVLVADDHGLMRAGLRALLEEIAGFEVVGEAADGYEALKIIRELRPDVALVDISMPGLNGLETAGLVARDIPRTRVLLISMHKDEEYVRQALLSGAAGYLLKDAERAELELAVRAVARGDTWFSPAVSRVVAAFARGDAGPRVPFELLTPRQRQVLQLIAEGQSTKEIAERLQISAKTVETHRAQLIKRLGVHGVPALVRYAIRVGIVRNES